MTPDVPPTEPELLPSGAGSGCGLAAYAGLLLTICLTGIIGIVLSTQAMLMQEPESVSRLIHGSQVATGRLQPMRDAGLLALTEVPDAWHDESGTHDGTRACALIEGGVAALTDQTITIGFDAITEVAVVVLESGGAQVAVHAQSRSATCAFGPREGADRFVRQIEAERLKRATD